MRPARLALAVGALLALHGQPSLAGCAASIAGPTMNWAGSLCEWRAETDDTFSPAVQVCLKRLAARDHIRDAPAEMCTLNRRYKTDICRTQVKQGLEKSVPACLRSVQNIPTEVRNGIGG